MRRLKQWSVSILLETIALVVGLSLVWQSISVSTSSAYRGRAGDILIFRVFALSLALSILLVAALHFRSGIWLDKDKLVVRSLLRAREVRREDVESISFRAAGLLPDVPVIRTKSGQDIPLAQLHQVHTRKWAARAWQEISVWMDGAGESKIHELDSGGVGPGQIVVMGLVWFGSAVAIGTLYSAGYKAAASISGAGWVLGLVALFMIKHRAR